MADASVYQLVPLTNQWNSFITAECLILGISPLNTGAAGRHNHKVVNSSIIGRYASERDSASSGKEKLSDVYI